MAASFTKTSNFRSKATNHGRIYESVALDSYCEATCTQVTRNAGIHVCVDHPFLACSPDGLAGEEKLEVKCPYVARDMIISPATVPYLNSDSHEVLHLDATHKYYYQVQGAMLCTSAKSCDFVVWTHKDMVIVDVPRNDCFISNMLSKLKHFFNCYFQEALLNRFYYLYTDKYVLS